MKPIRTFIAIDVPAAQQKEILRLQTALRSFLPHVRWVSPPLLHITLHFLGEVPAPELDKVAKAVAAGVKRCAPFAVLLQGVGGFPPRPSPRVIWLGVAAGAAELRRLYAVLADELALSGFSPGQEEYHPHVTLGRVPVRLPAAVWQEVAQRFAGVEVGPFPASEVRVVRSDLTPHGPQYTTLASFPLEG
ncbi:MAG: RNA 2',3'-cyclic phosphodiesterase [Bacillota bacterium]|nr:RNA 2',3'-cyclic phosphodiesterase [Bacillota bacterium]